MTKFLKKLRESTYYGFPMVREIDSEVQKESKSNGVALLIALMTIMLMVSLVADMIITSTVNLEMAVASRDRVRSEYLAKSGFNFALFFVSISWGFDLFRAQPSTPAIMKDELHDDSKSIWSMINKLPPMGAQLLELMKAGKVEKNEDLNDDDPFKMKGLMNEKAAEKMMLFEDLFSIKVIDESSKININGCYKGRCIETIEMLKALFSCPAERSLLQSKNLEPEQLAYRIRDFISDSTSASPETGFSDKNSPYLDQSPPYTTKGVPFDSIDELKLVAGWDDELHTVFAPYLTVYPYPTEGNTNFRGFLNINTIASELLSCLIPEARSSNCAENFAQKMYKIKKDNDVVFNVGIKETLSNLACLSSSTASPTQGSDPASTGSSNDPVSWFDRKSSVFRIEVNANTGKQSRKLLAIIRRIMPQEKANQREQQPFKRSYQILHWKLL